MSVVFPETGVDFRGKGTTFDSTRGPHCWTVGAGESLVVGQKGKGPLTLQKSRRQ